MNSRQPIAAAEIWEKQLGPLLSSRQVRVLLGLSRQRVHQLLHRRRLIGLGVASSRRRRYPAFQFHNGRPPAPLVEAFWTVAAGTEDEWAAAAWCTMPNAGLEDASPAAWAARGRDPDRLAAVARQDATRLAR